MGKRGKIRLLIGGGVGKKKHPKKRVDQKAQKGKGRESGASHRLGIRGKNHTHESGEDKNNYRKKHPNPLEGSTG